MARIATHVVPHTLPSASAFVELFKPISWFPPMWAFVCGLISAGTYGKFSWLTILGGIALTGPLVCGTSQVVNDWFDREVDAINEPGRPVPSGRMPGRAALYLAVMWTALSLVVAQWLGAPILIAAAVGLALAWAYSAPPLRLKRNGWWGNSAVALCYEGLPWLTGASLLSATTPSPKILIVAALYSVCAHGVMTLSDFKSVSGDRRMGIRSLPVQHGESNAAAMACFIMAVPQFIVVALMFVWGLSIYASVLLVLWLIQLALMERLLDQPRDLAPWYNATGVSLYVTGMLVTAFALHTIL